MSQDYFESESREGVLIVRALSQPFEVLAQQDNEKIQAALIADFRSRMNEVQNSLVVDLTDIGLVKSLTLNLIVRMLRDRPNNISNFAMCGKPYLLEIWETMNFEKYIGPFFDNLDSAVKAVQPT